jgi:N-acetylmuramoyl-L-alanine amidase
MIKAKKLFISFGAALSILFVGATSSFAYTVKQGDTLNGIAKANGTTLSSLIALNPQISNPNRIFIGDNVNLSNTQETANTTQSESPISSTSSKITLTSSEQDLLARIIRAEADGEPYAGQVAVGTVVLNRVLSDSFPNNVHDVVYQSGQFSPVANGAINKAADADAIRAAAEAVSFVNSGQSKGALFFYNPKTAVNSSWLAQRETVITIGNHVFKK